MTSQAWNNFQLFCLGKITKLFYLGDVISCNIMNYQIRRQSKIYNNDNDDCDWDFTRFYIMTVCNDDLDFY